MCHVDLVWETQGLVFVCCTAVCPLIRPVNFALCWCRTGRKPPRERERERACERNFFIWLVNVTSAEGLSHQMITNKCKAAYVRTGARSAFLARSRPLPMQRVFHNNQERETQRVREADRERGQGPDRRKLLVLNCSGACQSVSFLTLHQLSSSLCASLHSDTRLNS